MRYDLTGKPIKIPEIVLDIRSLRLLRFIGLLNLLLGAVFMLLFLYGVVEHHGFGYFLCIIAMGYGALIVSIANKKLRGLA